MDVALPPEDLAAVRDVLKTYEEQGIQFHALRSRQAGARKFISTHVLVPGDWAVQRGHELLDKSEVRYEVRIEVKAAYDPLEITEEDLGQDLRAKIAQVLRQLEGISEENATFGPCSKVNLGWGPCQSAALFLA